MTSVKIIGAGSIGNHLSHASRSLGWNVDLCDVDQAALERTKNEIYPSRYEVWDDGIRLFVSDDVPKGEYDMIFIGTPPDSHIPLALEAVREKPRAVLIEKPVCTPDLEGAQVLYDLSRELGVSIFTGYDHVVGEASEKMTNILASGSLGNISTIDVEFREYWEGIFNAHPWLDGPKDTYLGFWERGGGASGEHSHAANLWQHFSHACGGGKITEVNANLDFVNDGTVDYDQLCLVNVKTESGIIGRIVQDVVTQPSRKWARVQGSEGFVEWFCGAKQGCDTIVHKFGENDVSSLDIEKTRPDDFIRELRYIEKAIEVGNNASDISIECGLDTMLVVAAMHLSNEAGCTVKIDYSKGYSVNALSIK